MPQTVVKHSLQFLEELYNAEHDAALHDWKMILLKDTFTFDIDDHSTLADIATAEGEIATGNGYTQGGVALVPATTQFVQDAVNKRVAVVFDNVTFTASVADLPAVGGALVYNDTHANDTVVCCIDFPVDHIVLVGTSLQINLANGLSRATVKTTA